MWWQVRPPLAWDAVPTAPRATAEPLLLLLAIPAYPPPTAVALSSHPAGFEARGLIFGAPLAVALGCAFVPLRKPGKLPGAWWCTSVRAAQSRRERERTASQHQTPIYRA